MVPQAEWKQQPRCRAVSRVLSGVVNWGITFKFPVDKKLRWGLRKALKTVCVDDLHCLRFVPKWIPCIGEELKPEDFVLVPQEQTFLFRVACRRRDTLEFEKLHRDCSEMGGSLSGLSVNSIA